jgi:hypothetical protein
MTFGTVVWPYLLGVSSNPFRGLPLLWVLALAPLAMRSLSLREQLDDLLLVTQRHHTATTSQLHD